MGQKRKQLSHAEVWDDSALLQSWDDALTEYKLYHSIQARRERVEDVIEHVIAEEETMHMTEDNPHRPATGTHTNGISSEKLEDGELEDEPKCAQEHPNGDTAGSFCGPSTSECARQQPLADASIAVDPAEKPSMPNAAIDGVKDETLRNLMMSWYYAGYYSGLYEGQQQVQSLVREHGK